MSPSTSESQPVARPSFGSGTLIVVALWACAFAIFIVLGLRS